jgi:DNA-binding NarL/FixJ family response regulator
MARLPNTSILMLSMHSDEEYVHRALKAGARGYLLKDSVESNLLEAITAVHDGKTFFSSEILEMLVAENARFS